MRPHGHILCVGLQGMTAGAGEPPDMKNTLVVDIVLFLRQITTWVSPEIGYEREFQGGLGLFQLFWDILILIPGLVSVSTQSLGEIHMFFNNIFQ